MSALEPRPREKTGPLGAAERYELAEMERVIEAHLNSFLLVGEALLTISEARLYRETHETFEAYVQGRWGMSRQRGYQLMDAARTQAALSTTVDIPAPTSERQTRELASLPPEQQREVWTEAVERNNGVVPTAAQVREVRDELLPRPALPPSSAGTPGGDSPQEAPAVPDEGIRELRRRALDLGIHGAGRMRKAELLERIAALSPVPAVTQPGRPPSPTNSATGPAALPPAGPPVAPGPMAAEEAPLAPVEAGEEPPTPACRLADTLERVALFLRARSPRVPWTPGDVEIIEGWVEPAWQAFREAAAEGTDEE